MNYTERELNMRSKSMRSRRITFAIGVFAIAVFISGVVGAQTKQSQSSAGLPSDLFVKALPENPVDVGEARKTAQQGQQIVIKGRIGGVPNPFADKYAIFVLSDLTLLACVDECSTPWDYCCTPREKILANVATVQVVDGKGKPLNVSVKGVNGLNPLSEVVVRGLVAKQDGKTLIVNAQNIFVGGHSAAAPGSAKTLW
jgi:hypothetical protein